MSELAAPPPATPGVGSIPIANRTYARAEATRGGAQEPVGFEMFRPEVDA